MSQNNACACGGPVATDNDSSTRFVCCRCGVIHDTSFAARIAPGCRIICNTPRYDEAITQKISETLSDVYGTDSLALQRSGIPGLARPRSCWEGVIDAVIIAAVIGLCVFSLRLIGAQPASPASAGVRKVLQEMREEAIHDPSRTARTNDLHESQF